MTGILTRVWRDGATRIGTEYADGSGSVHEVEGEAARAARARLSAELVDAPPHAVVEAYREVAERHPASEAEVLAELERLSERIGHDDRHLPSELTVILVRPCNQGPRWEAFRGVSGHMVVVRPAPEPCLHADAQEGTRKRRQSGSHPSREAALEAAHAAIQAARESWSEDGRRACEEAGVVYVPRASWPPVREDIRERHQRTTPEEEREARLARAAVPGRDP